MIDERKDDIELSDPLADELREWSAIAALPGRESLDILNEIAVQFEIDTSQLFWWNSDSSKLISATPHNGTDLDFLDSFFNNDEELYFVPTDDRDDPWNVYIAKFCEIKEFILDTRYFEYFIAKRDLSLIVFDTHHNEFIVFEDKKNGA